LNALVGYERAIVSPIAGTTRDTIEDRTTIAGVGVRLIDTAGLGRAGDVLEQASMARTRDALVGADVPLAVLSADSEWREFVAGDGDALTGAIWLVNKSDLGALPDPLAELAKARGALLVSARTGAGIAELERRLTQRLGASSGESALVSLARHAALL